MPSSYNFAKERDEVESGPPYAVMSARECFVMARQQNQSKKNPNVLLLLSGPDNCMVKARTDAYLTPGMVELPDDPFLDIDSSVIF